MKRFVALQVKSKISILILADDSTKTVNNALTALAASEIPAEEISRKGAEPSHQLVGSRALATAKDDDSQVNKGLLAVASGSDPTICANRVSRIVHRELKGLTRRERRALQRRTTPRFDRFAGPHFRLPQKII